MTHRFYLPACKRKRVVWMVLPSYKTFRLLSRRVNYIVQWATPSSPVRFERGRDDGNPPRVVPEKIGEILNSSYAE